MEFKIDQIDPALDLRTDVDPNQEYELTSLLGEGSYGAVYKAHSRRLPTQEDVAVKIIPDAHDDLTALWREIRFLQVLRSPFVVSFIESLLFDNELWLVMELCDGGSLYDLKEANNASFTEPQLQGIMAFCALGLAHLHAQMSIHRDVKAGNILLSRDGRAKLSDFGVSAQLTDTIMKRRTVIGSPYWMAPEVIQEASYDGKADIWSLGITLLEICEGAPPLFHVHPMRAIFMISSRSAPTFKEPNRWSAEMKDFLSCCLIKDFDKRASAAELLKHDWIRKVVIEIGANGQGLPVLQNLMEENWDALEQIRLSRCKVPENIAVAETAAEMNNNNNNNLAMAAEAAGIAVIPNQPSTPTISRKTNITTTTSSINAGEEASSPTPSVDSNNDHNTISIARKHSFGLGGITVAGIAATRQQLRNVSLRYGSGNNNSNNNTNNGNNNLFPNANFHHHHHHHNNLNLNTSMLNTSFTNNGTMIRHNPLVPAVSINTSEYGGYDDYQDQDDDQGSSSSGRQTGTFVVRPIVPYQNDWQHNSGSVIRSSNIDSTAQTKKEYSPNRGSEQNNNNGTMRQNSTFLTSIDRYYDSNSMMKVASSEVSSPSSSLASASSFIQRPTDLESPSTRQDNKNNIQAALRYFRNDPPTPVSASTPNSNHSNNTVSDTDLPALAEEKLSLSHPSTPSSMKLSSDNPKQLTPNNNNNNMEKQSASSHKNENINRTSRSPPVPLQYVNRKLPPVPPSAHASPSSMQAAEAAILDELTNSSLQENNNNTAENQNTTKGGKESIGEDRKDFMKKEIMMQLVTLKKQYREDIETLTKTYEARRNVLKDALLQLSSNNRSSNNQKDKSAK